MAAETPALIGDIGATNARFALVGPTGIEHTQVLRVAEHSSIALAISAYLDSIPIRQPPRRAALAIASPITDDHVEMTNSAWSFSIAELRDAMAFDELKVINDFIAVALSAPQLGPRDLRQIGGGRATPNQAIALIGPGTGLGASGIIPGRDQWTPLGGEGGHVTMCGMNDREDAVIRRLRQRFTHVSAERVLSGMGLANLYETLATLDGVDARAREPHEVTEGAMAKEPYCVEAVAMFCAMLGTVAGNLALSLGSRGGVYIGGGVVPRLGHLFLQSDFRKRFEEKGRLTPWLAAIPTYLITNPFPAFLGLKKLLEKG